MKKIVFLTISVILGLILGCLGYFTVKAQSDYTNQPACQSHPNQKLAWTLNSAWLSTNKTGNWETDNWFYMMKPYQPVYVLNSDYRSRYYFVCFQFDSDWTPLYGWVEMKDILLNSDVR